MWCLETIIELNKALHSSDDHVSAMEACGIKVLGNVKRDKGLLNSCIETAEIMLDSDMMEQIKKSEEDAANGKIILWEDVKRDLDVEERC